MSNSLFDLSGQVALITGTSRGLGQYFARALAKAGADLILTSRKRETLAQFEAEMRTLGRRVASLELDVRDEASIRSLAAEAETALGPISILVNNAGCNVRKPALDVTWDDWNLVLQINLEFCTGGEITSYTIENFSYDCEFAKGSVADPTAVAGGVHVVPHLKTMKISFTGQAPTGKGAQIARSALGGSSGRRVG